MVSSETFQVFHEVQVLLPNADYTILIGEHLLENPRRLTACIRGRQVLVVTNDTIAPIYLTKLLHALQAFQCNTVILPEGEAYKNQASVTKIHEALITHQHHRDTTLIALGGGVIGDLTGFAASTYHRGVDLIQIPTTLLAAVDAAVGGKTAINYPGAKNAVGSFHQPRAVWIDITYFKSLPQRVFQSAFGEIIKYALLSGDLALPQKPLPDLIAACCRIKAEIIAEDMLDKTGRRALLNLGHTFGHALEAYTNYKRFLHGEAVGIGLYYAARLSHEVGTLDMGVVVQVDDLLKSYQMPRRIPHEIRFDALYALMQQDKKVKGKQILFILLKALGDCYLSDAVTQKHIQDVLKLNADS